MTYLSELSVMPVISKRLTPCIAGCYRRSTMLVYISHDACIPMMFFSSGYTCCNLSPSSGHGYRSRFNSSSAMSRPVMLDIEDFIQPQAIKCN